MSRLRKHLFVLMLACIALISVVTASALAAQTHMWAAHANLESALDQLQSAIPDKAGHRENAIRLVKDAIGQVNMGITAGAR